MTLFRTYLPILWMIALLFGLSDHALAEVVVITNPHLPNLDKKTISRIYTGKTIEVNGIYLTPFNLSVGQAERQEFLQKVLDRTEDSYISYWMVRTSIGKGVAPKEIGTQQELIELVRNTPGGIGYIDQVKAPLDVKILKFAPQ